MINSDEYFYLNLIELKEAFGEINFFPSQFIKNIDEIFKAKFLNSINRLKKKKLLILKEELNKLIISLSKIKDTKISFLNDHIIRISASLSQDLDNNLNVDNLISKYILDIKENKKKSLEIILSEINENGDITIFNYLYLIGLNNYNLLDKKYDEINSNKINKNESNIIIKNEEIINDINNQLNNKESDISKDDIKKKNENEILHEKFKKNFERIMKIEELRIKMKKLEEKELPILNFEKIDEEEKDELQNYINKTFLYDKIFNINKDNIYDVLCFLMSLKDEKNYSNNIDNVYIEYKNNFVEKVKNIYRLNYDYFYDLIMDKKFYDNIIYILNSESIKYYLTSKRFYDEKDVILADENRNEYEFEFGKDGQECIENLSEEYNKFMKEMKNPVFFMNLFRLKYLPYKIRGITNSNLKIIVNSLYYEFNKNINDNSKRIILSAALKILIVHEVVHILKFLKNNTDFGKLPRTPRKRENGKMIIYYLFGKPIINRITLEEATKINNIKYWNDVNSLRLIFSSEEDLSKNERKIKENLDHIDLYITEEDQEDEKRNDSIDNDNDLDID